MEANGERLSKDTSENKELTITKDEDEEHLNYDEFVYAVGMHYPFMFREFFF